MKRFLAMIALVLAATGCTTEGNYMMRQQSDLSVALAGSGVSVERRGDDILMQMPDVTFDFGRSTIKREYEPYLNEMAFILNQYADTHIFVVGHADSTGDAAFNQRLSEERAQAVAFYLQSRGLGPHRFSVSGRGETQPIASNATAEGRALNRRVEVLIREVRR